MSTITIPQGLKPFHLVSRYQKLAKTQQRVLVLTFSAVTTLQLESDALPMEVFTSVRDIAHEFRNVFRRYLRSYRVNALESQSNPKAIQSINCRDILKKRSICSKPWHYWVTSMMAEKTHFNPMDPRQHPRPAPRIDRRRSIKPCIGKRILPTLNVLVALRNLTMPYWRRSERQLSSLPPPGQFKSISAVLTTF